MSKGLQKRWYRITEVARILGLSRNTVSKLVYHDVIPSMKLQGLDLVLIPWTWLRGVEDEVIQGWRELLEAKVDGGRIPLTASLGTADPDSRPESIVSSEPLAPGSDRDPTQGGAGQEDNNRA